MTASMAGRYASALFDLAKEQGQVSAVEGDFKTLRALMDESADLRMLVRSPMISAHEQANAIDAILTKAGANALTANFLRLVARQRRLFAVADMMKEYAALAARDRGEVAADVATAHPLSDAQMTQLKDVLRIAIGKDVQVNTRVDPALLGGLVVKVGSKMIDSSLRTKLNNLKVAMKGIG